MLQPENIDILTGSLVATAEVESANCPEVEFLADAYRKLFQWLSKCHHGYSHCESTTDVEINDLGKIWSLHASLLLIAPITNFSFHPASNIHQFLKQYRGMFPGEAITPKMHILETHVTKWMKRWHVGTGFHNEQGGESLHNKFNQLQRQFASTRDPLTQLKLMLKEHHVQIMATKDLMEPPRKITKV